AIQGMHTAQACARLGQLVDSGNADGYTLHNNSFTLGGGWLKPGEQWTSIYSITLEAGKKYRLLAAGDNNVRNVDLRILNAKGIQVAIDGNHFSSASVDYTSTAGGRYTVQMRLQAANSTDAVCLSALMEHLGKRKR
ncbi:MAG TPA: hypothetical protein VFE62_17420, partial [Gemmataceae bacterium]|nr:hypothetical protein [Gemmataceae bacterium]